MNCRDKESYWPF